MSKTIFEGAGVAIITPFVENGTIDYDRFGELIDYQIDNDTDAIIVCGTTGESSTMNDFEHINAINYAVERVNGRVPVIAGTGSNDTSYAINLSKKAELLGVDAVLLVTPYYNKTTQRGLVEHFSKIAAAINIPIILYNIPGRTGMNIDVSTMEKLSNVENIVAIKEASGNISYTAKLMSACRDRFDVYSGNDDMILPIMSLGGKGVISVLSHIIPKETHRMVQLCLENNFKEATDIQLNFLDLINALFCEVNPIPVKAALNIMGWNVGRCRLPLSELSDENYLKMKSILWSHGLIK
ncbi:MAG: 4-hydroxy-tetrahydrodipicolinate synthase [Clostridia bacterium]|nr:4-hydroxy-tetrahydrodipicolinate synthase [Clostridia bacterium]